MRIKKFRKKELVFSIICLIILIIFLICFKWKGLISLPIIIICIISYWNRKKIKRIIKTKIKEFKEKKEKKNINTDNDEININEKKGVEKVKRIKTKKNNRNHSNRKEKGKKNILKKTFYLFLILCIFGCLCVLGFFAYIVVSTSKFDPTALASQEQTVIYDINGEVMTTLGREKRENITYDELPQVLIDAIIATEDSRFYQHNGVDLARFLKASVGQVLGNRNAGGASTLTMQVVKNNLTSREQSIIRKFKDIYLSIFHMEKKYSKEEIFEFYVNDSLLGGNVYGVGQAAEYYFGKDVSELSLPEAALLAGLFQSPNGDNPYYSPENATKRRDTVLKLMVRHNYITQEEADIAKSIPVESLLNGSTAESNYQGYIDTVVEEVKELTDNDPYLTSMKIYTTMEKEIQDGINGILSGETFTWENDVVQSGISVVNVETGAIAAIGAGRNRVGEKTFNYATMAIRQPGSTAKPLFDYGPGFEYNNYSTYTLFVDEPWTYSGTNINVNNWDGGYSGLISLRTALSQSRNVPALKAFQDNKKSNIIDFVTKLGIKPENNDGSIHEAHAIGGFTGVTTLQMAGAYSAFASGGYYVKPYTVTKIEYRSTGEVVEPDHTKERVMSDSTAYLVSNVLEYATKVGFAGGASNGGHVAAKTGTSNYDTETMKKHKLPGSAVNDLWTVGYTSKYSVALWYGYDELSSEYFNKSNSPKGSVMAAVFKYIPVDNVGFTMPSSVVSSQVEFGSWPAKLPSAYTPSDLVVTEYFKKGTQPTEESERFSKLPNVDTITSTTTNNTITLKWNYTTPNVLTESYLKDYFNQSVFGNSKDSYYQQRLNYNNSTLGGLGFGIYEKTSSGLKEVAFVTDKTYKYTINSKNVNSLVVKAEYRNFKANASDGTEVKIDSSKVTEPAELNINANNVTIDKGMATKNDFNIKVTYNNKDITNNNDLELEYIVREGSINKNYSTIDKALLEINLLIKGTHKMDIKATYKGETITKTITITVNEDDSTN